MQFRTDQVVNLYQEGVYQIKWITDPTNYIMKSSSLVLNEDDTLLETIDTSIRSRLPSAIDRILISKVIDAIHTRLKKIRDLSGFVREAWNGSQYKYVYTFNKNISMLQGMESVMQMIKAIAYNPLYIDIDQKILNNLFGLIDLSTTTGEYQNIMASTRNGLLSIAGAICTKVSGIEVGNVTETRITDSIGRLLFLATPLNKAAVTTGEKCIYGSQLTQNEMNVKYNIYSYHGWRFLSSNPLALYALHQFAIGSQPDGSGEPVLPVTDTLDFEPIPRSEETAVPVLHKDNMYLIPATNDYNYIIDRFNMFLKSYTNLGYQVIEMPVTVNRKGESVTKGIEMVENSLITIHYELFKRFDYKVVENGQNYYRFRPNKAIRSILPPTSKTDIKLPLIVKCPDGYNIETTQTWIKESINRIVNNSYPLMIVRGEWQNMVTDPGNLVSARVYLLAHMVYKKLVQNYPYLRSAVFDLSINTDQSINVPVTSRVELNIFERELRKLYHRNKFNSWTVTWCKDIIDVSLMRWALQQRYPENQSMAISLRSSSLDEKTGIYLAIDKDVEMETIQNMRIMTKPFMTAAQEYFSELGSLDNLNSILELVPIIDLGPDAIQPTVTSVNRTVFIRSSDTISSDYPLYVNPSSQNYVSQESLSMVLTYPQGWMGLYDIVIPTNSRQFLRGMYTMAPVKYLVPVDGVITVQTSLPETNFENQFMISFKAQFDPGNYSCYNRSGLDTDSELILDLFTLAYQRSNILDNETISPQETKIANDMVPIVQQMWEKGWFLSQWSTALAYANYSDKAVDVGAISCMVLNQHYPLDEILKTADRDTQSGRLAWNYLTAMYNMLLS